MKILDQIVLNRLISIILNFIVGILKIFAPNSVDNIDTKPKKRKRLFPNLIKDDTKQ
jgi:hypothetical protein